MFKDKSLNPASTYFTIERNREKNDAVRIQSLFMNFQWRWLFNLWENGKDKNPTEMSLIKKVSNSGEAHVFNGRNGKIAIK